LILTSQISAAPSSTQAGTVASGGSYGSLIPGTVYPSDSQRMSSGVSNVQNSLTGTPNFNGIQTTGV